LAKKSTGSPARVAFSYPNFRLYMTARFLSIVSSEMISVAVGWQIYALTHRPLDLGLVGLAQFAPGVLLFLISGHTADRHSRKAILRICYSAFAICSAVLLALTFRGIHSVWPIYAVLLSNGAVRAFNGPAGQAFLPQLVKPEHFPNAVTWSSSFFQTATILGPMAGGLIYGFAGSPAPVYVCATVAYLIAVLLLSAVRLDIAARKTLEEPVGMILDGLRYIWRGKLILGCMSLDLFAVLLGGAVALLPVYAAAIERQQTKFNASCVGRTLEVLFEKPGRHPGQITGRSPYLQPVQVAGSAAAIGDVGAVTITGIRANSLFGTLAREPRRGRDPIAAPAGG
jgi:MFS family permease